MRSCMVILCVVIGAVLASRYKKNLVFSLGPGDSTCFIKRVASDKVIEVVYKVLEATSDEASISFDLLAPSTGAHARGSAVRTRRWPAGAHVLDASNTGEYRFCFDNSFDPIGKKTIFFEINIRPKSKKRSSIHRDITLINTSGNGNSINEDFFPDEDRETTSLQRFGLAPPLPPRYRDIDLDLEKAQAQPKQMFFIVKGKL